ncbi:Virulence factors putative positive transcription regulator BvgA [Gemmata obscuriglobus]|uniref:Response regulator n=1 Tax=Gemmata obscuriglobus TaxID=114 RepID=A0A2Z3H327_9BACT|nr:response regulator [Gemmata obscuriglobus]AWM36014.1 response regulator [Gemmata obscuriglobus]QEG31415.1 Virulence factors putative positive transcription regulator BvgA [Gemmata obscuriglobus]VTS10756.1 family transcriptional regulator : Two component transcriptional regulator, winged helix family OS=Halothermothrix orenii (strain H 168 / OCM 544 / DSM 9562) GN=Hore_04710 PE=4 SV=1: Response_reg [Gemmata obscuriglobus UQM 2246]
MALNDCTPLPTTLLPRPRVLVVDDEPSIRMIARVMLERAGFLVDAVGDAADAVRRVGLADRPFSVALLDVSLPDRSGVELMSELRALAPHVKFVLMSGRPEEDLPRHGADGYLAKPFLRDQLVAAVRAAMVYAPR